MAGGAEGGGSGEDRSGAISSRRYNSGGGTGDGVPPTYCEGGSEDFSWAPPSVWVWETSGASGREVWEMSHQFSVGQRVKVVGPARVERGDPPETWECVAYPWGTVVGIIDWWGKDLYRVEYEGHRFAPYALVVPGENLLDYFTAICQDAIDDVSK